MVNSKDITIMNINFLFYSPSYNMVPISWFKVKDVLLLLVSFDVVLDEVVTRFSFNCVVTSDTSPDGT